MLLQTSPNGGRSPRDDGAYEAFLLDHVSGALGPAGHLAADLHLLLKPEARTLAQLWEAVGGALLDSDAAGESAEAPSRRSARAGASAGISAADILARSMTSYPWKRGVFGVETARIGVRGGRLLRLSPGKTAPRHGHHGLEATVVLQGAFEDEFGYYEKGDIALVDGARSHAPRAVGDEACVCFAAEDPAPRGLAALRLWMQ